MDDARVREIERIAGEGGYVSYRVRLQTPSGPRDVTFSGNIFVGPVAVTADTDGQWADEVIDDPAGSVSSTRRIGYGATSRRGNWQPASSALLSAGASLEPTTSPAGPRHAV